MNWLDGITDLMDMSLSKLGDRIGKDCVLQSMAWGFKELDTTEQQQYVCYCE